MTNFFGIEVEPEPLLDDMVVTELRRSNDWADCQCKHVSEQEDKLNASARAILNAVSTSALDVQIAGSHYKEMKIQPVEFIHANGIGFLEGSAIKYLCRHRDKGGIDDLLKAKHFIDLLIELEYEKC